MSNARWGMAALAVGLGLGLGAVDGGAREQAMDTRRILLAVFAHPDDETIVGPLLARYGRQPDTDVYLAIATGGDQGVTPFAGIPAGDELVAVRAKEAACACGKLGIHPPILLGLPDGGLADIAALGELAAKIGQVIEDLRPDAIVTWGPDGGYGHPDHRLVSAVVTQIVQSGEPMARLYYAGLPKSRLSREASSAVGFPPFGPTEDRFLNVRVPYSSDDEARARAALTCHASQFTPETMEQLSALSQQVNDGVMSLRSWSGGAERADLFDE